MKRNKSVISIGVILLLVFMAAMWVVGRAISHTANKMHSSLVDEVGHYRADLLALDFQKTVELGESIHNYIENNPDNELGLQELVKGLWHLDRKVSRIWYKWHNNAMVCCDSSGVVQKDTTLYSTLKKIADCAEKQSNGTLFYDDGELYWTLYRKTDSVVYGLDISLIDVHRYFADMSPSVRSYAYVLNKDGIVLAHPDETRIGCHWANKEDGKAFNEVLRTQRMVRKDGVSDYLHVEVQRVYYPVKVGGDIWIIVVNIPDFFVKEEMSDFHRYTVLATILVLVLFCLLLGYSQYQWRKEYVRRRHLEEETAELSLQQLKNRINPHFLFNSFNSLSALIGTDARLAKEFVLNLSSIYRYSLDKRDESLVTVKEELDFMKRYYFLQKIRFQEQLFLEVDEEVEKEKRKIPFMALQMVVENAIKHNEITRQRPLYIHVYIEKDVLIVTNSHRPRSGSLRDSLGVGIESIRKIYDYYSENAQISCGVEGELYVCRLPLL